MRKIKLRNFYLVSWLILGFLMTSVYIWSGAIEGYVIAVILEFIYAAILAIIPTIIYFFLTHEK